MYCTWECFELSGRYGRCVKASLYHLQTSGVTDGWQVRDHALAAALLALTVHQISVWTKAGCTAMTTFLFGAAQLIDV